MAQDDNRDLTHVKPGVPNQRMKLAALADCYMGKQQLVQVWLS
ncbi:MAG: hypothetical protein WAV72_26105 [Bradyrhizobium sp.]